MYSVGAQVNPSLSSLHPPPPTSLDDTNLTPPQLS